MSEEEYLQLYDREANSVYRRCYFKTSSKEVAEELTQEAFMRLWQYVRKLYIEEPRALLFTIANNSIKDWYKKKKTPSFTQVGFEHEPEVADETQNVGAQAHSREIHDIIMKLEEEDRELIVLRFVEDVRTKDIADLLGVSENVVSVRLHRAKKKMQQLLIEHA
ncbi:MAG: sigma-70 family RNA polymerase sigma factor [bacterium]|nr:sigma-70 family RNA polymerase sigma factor [bacterium]